MQPGYRPLGGGFVYDDWVGFWVGFSMLITISEVLTPEQVHDCQQALLSAPWQEGKETAGYLAQQVKTNLQLPIDNAIAQQVGAFLLHILNNHHNCLYQNSRKHFQESSNKNLDLHFE